MITFWFRINDSFLGYPAHPITIPKSQVPYGDVADLLLTAREAWITIPGAPAIRAKVGHGIAGYGEYYQVRCLEPLLIRADQVSRGDLTQISLFIADGRLEIHLSRCRDSQTISAA